MNALLPVMISMLLLQGCAVVQISSYASTAYNAKVVVDKYIVKTIDK